MYKDYLTLLEEARQELRKAEQTAEAEQNAIMEIYNGSRFKFKRNAAPEEIEQAQQEEAKHTALYNKACDDKKFYGLVIRIAEEQLNYYGLNLIIDRIKNDPPKGIDKPFHYKAFKKALEGITPEGFSAYAYNDKLKVQHECTRYTAEAEKYLGYKTETLSAEVTKDWTTYNVIDPENIKAAAADVIGTRKEIERLYKETHDKIDGLRASVDKFAGRAIYDYLPYAPLRMDNYNHY
jgi:hypothetical protein